MEERRFPRSVSSLGSIFSFVDEFLAAHGIDREHGFDVNLVIEELFTNMVKYSREGRPEVHIGLGAEPDRITIRLRDFDVEAFDVTQVPPVDVDAPLSARRPGGLGIHLVRCIADDIRYDYRDRTSTIVVTKRLST